MSINPVIIKRFNGEKSINRWMEWGYTFPIFRQTNLTKVLWRQIPRNRQKTTHWLAVKLLLKGPFWGSIPCKTSWPFWQRLLLPHHQAHPFAGPPGASLQLFAVLGQWHGLCSRMEWSEVPLPEPWFQGVFLESTENRFPSDTSSNSLQPTRHDIPNLYFGKAVNNHLCHV